MLHTHTHTLLWPNRLTKTWMAELEKSLVRRRAELRTPSQECRRGAADSDELPPTLCQKDSPQRDAWHGLSSSTASTSLGERKGKRRRDDGLRKARPDRDETNWNKCDYLFLFFYLLQRCYVRSPGRDSPAEDRWLEGKMGNVVLFQCSGDRVRSK